MANVVGTLMVVLRANTAQHDLAIMNSAGVLRRFAAKTQVLGRTLTYGITLPLAAIGVAATKSALELDRSMTKLGTLVGLPEKSVQKLRGEFRELGDTLGQTTEEVSKSAYFISSAGDNFLSTMEKGGAGADVLQKSAEMAALGMTDMESAGQVLTTAMNAYGPSALSAADATEQLFRAVQIGKAEPDELARALGRGVSDAQAAGVEFSELTATIARLSQTGIPAQRGVTSFIAILRDLSKPSKEGTNVLRDLDMSVSDVKASLEEDFIGTLINLRKEIGDDDQALRGLFKNYRSLSTVYALTGKNAAASRRAFDRIAESSGAFERGLKRLMESPAFRFDQAVGRMKNSLTDFGYALIPILEEGTNLIKAITDAFGGLDEDAQRTTARILVLAAAFGPLLIIGGKLFQVGAVIGGWAKTAWRATLRVLGLKTATEAAGTAGVAAAQAEVIALEHVVAAVEHLVAVITTQLIPAWEGAAVAAGTFGTTASAATGAAFGPGGATGVGGASHADDMPLIAPLAKPTAPKKTAGTVVAQSVKKADDGIKGLIASLLLFGRKERSVSKAATGGFGRFRNVAKSSAGWLKDAAGRLVGLARGWRAAATAIRPFAAAVAKIGLIAGVIIGAVEIIIENWKKVVAWGKKTFSDFIDWWKDLWAEANDGPIKLADVIKASFETMKGMVAALGAAFKGLAWVIFKVFGPVAEFFTNTLGDAIMFVVNILTGDFKAALKDLGSIAMNFGGWFLDMVANIQEGILAFFKTVKKIPGGNALFDADDAIGKLEDAIKWTRDAADSAREWGDEEKNLTDNLGRTKAELQARKGLAQLYNNRHKEINKTLKDQGETVKKAMTAWDKYWYELEKSGVKFREFRRGLMDTAGDISGVIGEAIAGHDLSSTKIKNIFSDRLGYLKEFLAKIKTAIAMGLDPGMAMEIFKQGLVDPEGGVHLLMHMEQDPSVFKEMNAFAKEVDLIEQEVGRMVDALRDRGADAFDPMKESANGVKDSTNKINEKLRDQIRILDQVLVGWERIAFTASGVTSGMLDTIRVPDQVGWERTSGAMRHSRSTGSVVVDGRTVNVDARGSQMSTGEVVQLVHAVLDDDAQNRARHDKLR